LEHSTETAERGFEALFAGAGAGVDDLALGVAAGWADCARAAAGARQISATAAHAATALLILFIAHLAALQETLRLYRSFHIGSEGRHDHVIANEIMRR
jgi:hypothetical protein